MAKPDFLKDFPPASNHSSATPQEGEKRDVFPSTMHTWIDRKLDEGEHGRAELNHHVMSVYVEPLKIYLLGSSFRSLGDPDELVQGFFASRLSRESFFNDWRAHGSRLRRWLMNAFLFYLQETYRDNKRHVASNDTPEKIGTWSGGPDAAIDRAWAREIVEDALRQAGAASFQAGQDDHWQLFLRHFIDGVAYADLTDEFNIDTSQAAVMVRTATNKFKAALRQAIARDGVPDSQIDNEIQMLLGVISS